MARETDITGADSLTLYQTVRRMSDGQFEKTGGTFEAFNAANWATQYAQALTKTVFSATHLANYSKDFSAPAGIYKVEIYSQAGGSPSISADGTPLSSSYLIFWDGTKQVPPALLFDASYNVMANAQVAVVTSGTAASTSAVPITQDFVIGASNYFKVTFAATGLDSTGWTELVFTIKRDVEQDQDSEALVLVKLTNPGAGSDGLVTFNGAAALDATLGSIVVNTITPDTNLTLTLKAGALVIAPSGSTPYTWELVRFIGAGRKERIGTGNITIERPVMRGTAPL